MSDGEKIEELLIDAFEGSSKVGFTYEEMGAILSRMAEWKNNQFKEYLEKKVSQTIEDQKVAIDAGDFKTSIYLAELRAACKQHATKSLENFLRRNDMENERKQRVLPNEKFWYVTSNLKTTSDYDRRNGRSDLKFSCGNYFYTKEDAEAAIVKLRAVLKGADVIFMPDDETMKEARPIFHRTTDWWDAKQVWDGFERCFEWIKMQLVK